MSEKYKIKWLKELAEHDYSAALSYVSVSYTHLDVYKRQERL